MILRLKNREWLLNAAASLAFAAAAFGMQAPASALDLDQAETSPLVQQVGRDRGDRGRDRGDDRAEERFRDNEGEWELLGKNSVGFGADRDVIKVGRREGRFDKLALQVRRNDIEIIRMRVIYANGQSEELAYRETIREGSRARSIDLRGEGRAIEQIELFYRSKLSLDGNAVVFVYGRKAEDRPRRDAEGKRAGCETYASLAVVQAEANQKYRCDNRGGEWSDNKRGHYEWCLRNKREFMADEVRYRAGELQKCFDKLGDFDDENYDRGYRRRSFR